MQPTFVRKWLVCGLFAVALMAIVAGCGSDSSSSDTTAGSSTTAGESTEAAEPVDVATGELEGELPQGPNPVGKAAGKTIGFVSACQNCEPMARMSAAYEEAAAAAGMDVRIYDTKGNPADAAKGVETLLQAGADAIVLAALPPQVVGAAAEAAKSKDVPIYATFPGVLYKDSEGITAFNIEENTPEAQQKLAERLVEEVGPEAKVLYMFDEVLPVGQLYDAGIRKGLGKAQILDEAQVDLTKITEAGFDTTRTWLTKHPDAEAIICAYDAACLGAIQALEEAGKEIPVYSNNANLENLDLIREGVDTITNGLAIELASYLGVDGAISLLNGKDVPTQQEVKDLMIDSENVPAEGVYDGSQLYGDFRSAFEQRWGAE